MTRWFTLIRFIASGAVALTLIVLIEFEMLSHDASPYLSLFFVSYALFGVALYYIAQKSWCPVWLLYYQLTVDVGAVTIGLYLTGGIQSPFLALYIVGLLASSVIGMRQLALTVLVIIFSAFVLVYTETKGILRPFLSDGEYGQDTLISIAVFAVIAIIVAIQSYYFISRIRRRESEIRRLKEEFFFTAVHDLQNPITATQWMLEDFDRPEYIKGDERLQEMVERIHGINARMKKLLVNTLNIIKGQDDRFEAKTEPVNLTTLIENIQKQVEPLYARKGIVFTYEQKDNITICADTEQVREVFFNLIDNAIKYNKPKNGSISVEHMSKGSMVQTTVTNTGRGISKEDLGKMFTAYFRGDAEKTKIGGTGLGLYLVKQLVEKMNGTISVTSEFGKTTTFTVELPVYVEGHCGDYDTVEGNE